MRQSEDYFKLSRSPLFNHFNTENKKSAPGNKILDFITKRVWSWLYYYLRSRFSPKHAYPAYISPDTGIYMLTKELPSDDGPVCLAVVADWATDTLESIEISSKIAAHSPDYTIHMGDTYYVGAPQEIASNFTDAGNPWVRGKVGSFALLGNHEMFAQGIAFFDHLLQTLGIRDRDSGKYNGQRAGFFCLENDHWRVLGLDTGYHSISKPIIELVVGADCHFDDILIKWLKEIVRITDPLDKRGILILTHHQYVTAFKSETEYQKPAAQLAELIGENRSVLWLWGHEHKFSMFEKTHVDGGVTAYGRCIGHGGMPVEIHSNEFTMDPKAKGYSKLVMVDRRKKRGTDQYPLGYNGYALIKIHAEELRISYYDYDALLIEEIWKVDDQGMIKGAIQVEPAFSAAQAPVKNWEDAVI